MNEKAFDKSENEWPTGMVTNFHVLYSVWCAVCELDFDDTTPEEIRRRDEDEWANAVRTDAIRKGWKDFREHDALCPTCVEGNYLAEHELNLAHPERKLAIDARKAREAVLAATPQTWMQKLGRFFKKPNP